MAEPSAGPPTQPAPPPFPGPAAIGTALRFITGVDPPHAVAAWAVYLPLVGLMMGGLWLATDKLAEPIGGRAFASIAVLLVHVAATRGRGVIALAGVLAGIGTGPEGRQSVIAGKPGTAAYLFVLAVVLAELAVLSVLDRFRPVGLTFAPLLGCCGMVVLAVGSRAARPDGRRLKFAPAVQFREFGIASTATFALVFLTTDFLGLLLILATAAFTIAARVGSHRWLDGVNETVLLATSEATQLLILALLASW